VLPSGVTAKPQGPEPPGIVAVTVFVAVLITDTALEKKFDRAKLMTLSATLRSRKSRLMAVGR